MRKAEAAVLAQEGMEVGLLVKDFLRISSTGRWRRYCSGWPALAAGGRQRRRREGRRGGRGGGRGGRWAGAAAAADAVGGGEGGGGGGAGY